MLFHLDKEFLTFCRRSPVAALEHLPSSLQLEPVQKEGEAKLYLTLCTPMTR